jgi:hypothetical protein
MHEAIRDMAFFAFNNGDEIPGFEGHGYELLEVTKDSMTVRVEVPGPYAPRYFKIKVTEV